MVPCIGASPTPILPVGTTLAGDAHGGTPPPRGNADVVVYAGTLCDGGSIVARVSTSERGTGPAGFQDAVFISYTHIDNEPFGPEQLRWISHLHDQLANRVDQLLGNHMPVWRDDKLAGNDVFADTLIERLSRVAVLVSVCSPRYLRSEWCQRELSAFVDAAQRTGGLQAGMRSRIFKVLKTPVALTDLPAPLQPVLGYEFYEEDPGDSRLREYLLNPDPEQRWKFYARVDDLAQDIAQLLAEVFTSEQPAGRSADGGRTVYLAETTFDVAPERDRVRRELERHGHHILPSRRLPIESADLVGAIRDELAQSDVSVHLLGRRYGVVPEMDDRSLPHLQLELARSAAERDVLVPLIWAPERLETPEPRQAELLEQLAAGELGQEPELVRAPLNSFLAYLTEHITPPPPPAVEVAPAGESARVYLVCDTHDFEAVEVVHSALEAGGHVVMLPLHEGSEAEAREVHEMSLVLSDAVLLYWGHATEHWLRMKLFDLLKAPGWGRTEPFRAKAVYIAPPDTTAKAGYSTNEADVLHGGDVTTTLRPFLAELGRSPVRT